MTRTEQKQALEDQLAEARAVADELRLLSERLNKATEEAAQALGMGLRVEEPRG